MRHRILTYLLVLLPLLHINAQHSKSDQHIAFYINFLEQSQYIDTLSLENIFLITKRQDMRKVYIQNLKVQERTIQNKILRVQKYINQLEQELENVKATYAKMLVFTYLYKKFYPSNLIFILSSKSFNQAYLRIKFLQLSTNYLKSLTKVITLTKKELEYQKEILEKSLSVRRQLIKKIQYQQSALQEEHALLEQIEQNSDQYKALLGNLKDYELVRNALNRQVVSEIALEKGTATSDIISRLFEQKKGFLRAPLNGALIVIPFGIHQHPKLKSIKVRNDGVDITSAQDTVVKAVFKGKVTNIISLPNERRAVLVKHGQYFTVYSNLAQVFVNPGQIIRTGQNIGTIRRLSGEKYPILNFQIWYGAEKLNPQDWLNI